MLVSAPASTSASDNSPASAELSDTAYNQCAQASQEIAKSPDSHGDVSSNGVVSSGKPPTEAPSDFPGQTAMPPEYSIYTLWEKRLIVLGASLSAFFSPLTAQIYLPAMTTLAKDFHVTYSKISLTVTTYMIFQGVTPMFVGGLADTAGRRPAYVICFVIYIAANIGLALSESYASVMVVRCLQSAGSSTTVALCQAVVADIVTSAERGEYIGITVIPIVLAPSLGPVLGGVLSQYLGWRSIFWFLTIAAVFCLAAILCFLPETCRGIVGDGSVRPPRIYRTMRQALVDRQRARSGRLAPSDDLERTASAATGGSPAAAPAFKFNPPNVLGSLTILLEKEVGLLLGYAGVVFAGFYAISTAMPSQLGDIYGLNDIQVGLMYLPMAGGSVVAAAIVGPLTSRNYRRHALRLGLVVDKSRQTDLAGFPIERARLEVALPLLALSAAVITCWGWVLYARASLAAPCVLLFLMGTSMIGFSNATNALLIDLCPGRAGAAVAANNLTRCLIGAGASAAIVPMINAMGAGWAFTIFGLIYVAGAPVMLLIMWKGVKWRAEKADKEARKVGAKVFNESTETGRHGVKRRCC